MSGDAFSPDEIERCKAAMRKPYPRGVLRLIASGRGLFELTPDRCDVMIVELDGREIRDPDHPEVRGMSMAGAWPLYRAGMIDEFCLVTDAGRRVLQEAADA